MPLGTVNRQWRFAVSGGALFPPLPVEARRTAQFAVSVSSRGGLRMHSSTSRPPPCQEPEGTFTCPVFCTNPIESKPGLGRFSGLRPGKTDTPQRRKSHEVKCNQPGPAMAGVE